MIEPLLTLPCVLSRRSPGEETDAHGNPVPVVETVETVCELQQRSRSETPDDVSRSEWLLVLPAGVEVSGVDKITVEGTDYELVGDPWDVRHPRTGQAHHVEATVRKVTA